MADGAMGTMLQASDATLSDFDGHEGCNEILNVTRPDIVRAVHDGYLEAGVDCVTTNTFGANQGNLGEYGLTARIGELSEAGARLAREAAGRWATPDRPRWVLGSVGPGTKLPTLGHARFAELRDAYQENAAGLLRGGVDAIIVETCQDLLQAKAAIIGARRAMSAAGAQIPLIAQVTIETTGAMLLGSEIGAALTALEPLGITLIGLNCATGPGEMSEHLRYLAGHSRIPLSCMPNAGLPELTRDGARYPLTPGQLADAHETFASEFGLALVGGCCGTTPEHLAAVVDRLRGRAVARRRPRPEPGVASLYQHVPFRQDTSFLAIGERTNANGSKAFREALIEGRYDDCVEIARAQTRDGAHLLDLCVDYVGRDGTADMAEVAGRLATAATLPLVLDSTEPDVIRTGLELLAGRAVVNSVNYEDGDGPGSRIARVMPLVAEHGAAVIALTIDEQGQARTAEWKVAVATRLIEDLTGNWGMRTSDIIMDCLTFPIATGQEETRRDAIETIEAIRQVKHRYPDVQTTLGVSNVSFGLNPAARAVLNSVFLNECVRAGLDSAIVHASRIMPIARIPGDQLQAALDLVYDRRRDGYDPLARLLELFEGVDAAAVKASRAAELMSLPLSERLKRRIIDGERPGLEADLDEALAERPALEIVNDVLLDGMKTVGELFGAGQMQLPFVLQSAEVMKLAVGYLEPHMERSGEAGKGRIVLATVRGDVHDIGKNLVDIILTNNGYDVVNIGIKQPVSAIVDAASEHGADVIGMSGLLVKSTVVMRDNLAELNSRGLAARWPVLLGGAALTRAYVEQDLAALFDGEVRYARDAFEGLRLMDAFMAVKRGEAGRPAATAARAAGPQRGPAGRHRAGGHAGPVRRGHRQPGARAAVLRRPDRQGHPAGRLLGLPRRAGHVHGPVGAQARPAAAAPPTRNWSRPRAGRGCACGWSGCRPRGCCRRAWCTATSGPSATATTWSSWTRPGAELERFSFPRQRHDRHLCLADFFRPRASGETDVVGFQLVTVGRAVSEATAELFAKNAYREYLELHGLSVQLTEALAEYWHSRVRQETGLASYDPGDLDGILKVGYRGCRYSFGYPACPDLEDRAKVVRLLRPERLGVELSEEFQLVPEQSTDALITFHPEARYFSA